MKIKFKINLKESRIPEWIRVPKTLVEGKTFKNKLKNFIEKKYLNRKFIFEYDVKKKVLKSIDKYPKVIHGVYTQLNLNLIKKTKEGIYTHGWFTGYEGRFVGHDFLFRHYVTFDDFENRFVLINKVGYFFRKDGEDNYKLGGKTSGSYIWMESIK